MLQVGDQFPSFSLPDQLGNVISNETLKGKRAVVYFYPKDNTPGCTVEACDFQAKFPTLPGVTVVGVSPDSVKKHQNFANKFNLEFSLLADTERQLIEACGLWVEKSFMGKKYMGVDRTTYILDENGTIIKIFTKVNPIGHVGEVTEFLG